MGHIQNQNLSFGIINNTFINIYNEENQILHIDNECYFIFQNISDYHKLLIGRGVIVDDNINDGMNKTYFIKLLEIIESPEIINKFIYGKQFSLIKYDNNKITGSYIKYITDKTLMKFFENNLFKIDGFFVRKKLELITKLKDEFNLVIINDLENQLKEIKGN